MLKILNCKLGPAHAVYFGTYEVVKDLAGGNVGNGHHPLAAGKHTTHTTMEYLKFIESRLIIL